MSASYQAQNYKVYDTDSYIGSPVIPVVMVASSQGFLWDTDKLLNEYHQNGGYWSSRTSEAAQLGNHATRGNLKVAEIQLDAVSILPE